MVNKRMKAPAVLRLVKKLARQHGLSVKELPKRGKGSHTMYAVLDATDTDVGRFGLTGHGGELSWTVLGNTEDSLSHLFGEKWMEKR